MEQNPAYLPYTPSERLQKLLDRRDELMVARDILALELEIRDLKNQKTNGDTDTEKGQS